MESHSNHPTFKVSCQLDPKFHLTVREKKLILVPSDPDDRFQEWYKVERESLRVKGKQLFSCFAIVNKASGDAIKADLELIPYNPDVVDESVIWSESNDLGDGYRSIWMINNVHLILDALLGDDPIKNGTVIGLWKWNEGGNQRWKFAPQGNELTVTDRNSGNLACTCGCVNNPQCEAIAKSAADEVEMVKKEVNELRNDLNELKLKGRQSECEVAQGNAKRAAKEKQIETMMTKIESLRHEIQALQEEIFL